MFLSLLNQYRIKQGGQFRKSLGVFNYKIGKQSQHKKPGLIPLRQKEQIKNSGKPDANLKIKEKERNSQRFFGKFVSTGFRFDQKKVPFFNIPSLEHFKLRPYVSVFTSPVSPELKQKMIRLNDFNLEENFNRFKIESDVKELTDQKQN